MTKEERKKFRKVAQKYYQDYVQGKSVEHPELGKIKFTLKGIEETINKNLDSIRSVPRLEKNIKNAKLKEANELYKTRKDHYSIFYTLESKDEIYQIAKDENGLRYYLTKKK